jgi:hypothetical protein
VGREIPGQLALHVEERAFDTGGKLDHRGPHGVTAMLGGQMPPMARLDRVEQMVRAL